MLKVLSVFLQSLPIKDEKRRGEEGQLTSKNCEWTFSPLMTGSVMAWFSA